MTLARCWNPIKFSSLSAEAPVSLLSFSLVASGHSFSSVSPRSLERKYVPCEASSGVVGTCVWKERVVRVCVTRFSAFPRYRLGAFQLLFLFSVVLYCCVSHVRHSTQLAHPPHTPAPPPCVTRIHVVWPSFRSNTRKCLTVGRPVVAVHARVGKQSEEEIR